MTHERQDDHRHPDQVGCITPSRRTRGTLRALGLGRIGKTNTLPDRPEIRGMIRRVPHLVTVSEEGTEQTRHRRNQVTMHVHDLSPAPGATKNPKRVARGIGGKGGKTAGRGTKGQHSRGRGKVARGFEGGQMPLKQRVPKLKGFTNPFRVEYAAVNLDTLDALDESTVDPEVLIGHGLVRKGAFVKVLARGEINAQGRGPRPRRVEGGRGGDHRRRWLGDLDSAALQGGRQGRTPGCQGQPVHEPLIRVIGHPPARLPGPPSLPPTPTQKQDIRQCCRTSRTSSRSRIFATRSSSPS